MDFRRGAAFAYRPKADFSRVTECGKANRIPEPAKTGRNSRWPGFSPVPELHEPRGGEQQSLARQNKLKGLVIVESPAKARKINSFLGRDFRVLASMGHVRDLPARAADIPPEVKKEPWATLGVNVAADFDPLYVIPREKRKVISELKAALKEADELILATDEDREGESIGWHLTEILKPRVPVKRMVFSEITKDAISQTIASPRDLDQNLVAAQETRRVLDSLYG